MSKVRPVIEALEEAGSSVGTHARRLPDMSDGHRNKLDEIVAGANATDGAAVKVVTGKLPRNGTPNSFGFDENGKRMPYANSRPSYAKDQVKEVWDAAPKNERGEALVFDKSGAPVAVAFENRKDWDLGHVPKKEYRTLREQYLSHEITKDEFLTTYRNPKNYSVEHSGRNRSHVDESK